METIYLTVARSFAYEVQLVDDDNNPILPAPDEEVVFTIKKTPGSSEVLIQKTGVFFSISAEESKEWKEGKYVYDIVLTRGEDIFPIKNCDDDSERPYGDVWIGRGVYDG